MEQTLTIEILGKQFSFSTDTDVAEAQEVAEYMAASVDQAQQQCAQKSSIPDKWAILILAALNITNDYFDLKKRHNQLLNDISQRSTNLLHALESKLA